MNFEKYKNKLQYPIKQNYTVYYYFDKTARKEVCLPRSADDKNLTFIEQFLDDKYWLDKQAYDAETSRINQEFITCCFEREGVPDNKLTRCIYEHAYREGHSGGYSDIYSYFSDFIEIYHVAEEFFKEKA